LTTCQNLKYNQYRWLPRIDPVTTQSRYVMVASVINGITLLFCWRACTCYHLDWFNWILIEYKIKQRIFIFVDDKRGITIVFMCELFTHYQFDTIRWFGNCKDYEIAVKAPLMLYDFLTNNGQYISNNQQQHLMSQAS